MALNEAYGQTDVMHDPNYVRTLLASHDPRQRAQGEAALKDMQGREAHQQQLHEFEQREADRQLAREGGLASRQANTDQRTLAAEELNQRGQAAEGDKKTAIMAHLLANPDALRNVQGTGPESAISRAIVNKMLQEAKVSATLPVDPKAAAFARSKGLPVPQGEVLGGAGQPQTGATSDGRPVSPFGTTLNVDAGKVYLPHPAGTDINTNTGEFVPSSLVGTINGRPATDIIAEGALKRGVSPEDTRSREVYNKLLSSPNLGSTQPAPKPVASTPNTGINSGDLTSKQAPAPAEPNVAGEAFKRTNQDLGNIGQSMEPFTIAKNALGGLFSGGQGGANDIVKQPTPQVTPPAPQATPAPGTQFQGPLTATAGFLSSPNAPAPQPALTPPAIPPTKKPTPEEERQRMALQQ